MRSIALLLSVATVLSITLQIHAECSNQTTVLTCLRQLGLNSSYSPLIQDCNVAAPAGCVSVNQTCNTTLTANSMYDVICTTNGISFYDSANKCFNGSLTSSICRQNVGSTINCTTDASGNTFFSMSTVKALINSIKNCSKTAPASPGLTLLPNPVGPDAITAIVVLVCLAITVVLAGFFFWPKCHIADPAAEALKRASKPASAKAKTAANNYAVSSGASGPPQNKTVNAKANSEA